jgi:hypothetical protein
MGRRGLVVAAVALFVGCGGSGSAADANARPTPDVNQNSDTNPTFDATAIAGDGAAPDAGMAPGAPTAFDVPPASAVDALSIDATPPNTAASCDVVRTLSSLQSVAYAPTAVGHRWTYRGRTRLLAVASDTAEFQQRLEVTGTKVVNGVDAFVVTDSNPNGNPFPTDEYLVVSGAGSSTMAPRRGSRSRAPGRRRRHTSKCRSRYRCARRFSSSGR